MSRWRDVTIPMRPGMAVWPGDPEFDRQPLHRIAKGDSCNTSLLRLSTHTGTHMDAPRHFVERGKTLDQLDPDLLFGRAQIVDLSGKRRIAPEDFDGIECERVLIKTRNSEFGADDPFHEDFVALEPDAARALIEKGVRLVGIDYLSIAPFGDGKETHTLLLDAEVIVIEGLRLAGWAGGMVEFVALPLAIQGADGGPCRAFARMED